MDFFEQYEVNMQISNLTMTIEGYKFKLFKQPYDSCANVKISKLMVIPPDSEYTVEAYIKGNVEKQLTILEPYKSIQKRGLLVARSVYDASSEVVQINTINLTDETIILDKDTLVGRLEPVKSISTLNDIQMDSNLETNKNDNIPEHLKVMIEKASLALKNEEKLKFQNLILTFQDIFLGPDLKLGRTDLVRHSIDTENAKPVKIPPRRIPISQKQVSEKEIDRLLEADLIEPSNSPWSAPILLVTKKDGSIRFCVDY